jgi:hypothetical protein
MIKPEHDSQEKGLPDPGEKRGSRMRSLRTSTRKVTKIQDRIYGKKHGLDRVYATRHQTIFLTKVHNETWVGLAVKLWGSISCAGVNSRVKHSWVRKYQHKHESFFFEVSLAKLKVIWGGSSHEQDGRHFLAKRFEYLQYHLDSKARETHDTT